MMGGGTGGLHPFGKSKAKMLDQGVTDIDKANKILMPKGVIDRDILLKAHTPFGGIGKGRTVRALYRNAMNAKLRAETGAQANPSELDDMEKRWQAVKQG